MGLQSDYGPWLASRIELGMQNQGYKYIACPVTAILTNGIEVGGGEAVCVLP